MPDITALLAYSALVAVLGGYVGFCTGDYRARRSLWPLLNTLQMEVAVLQIRVANVLRERKRRRTHERPAA